MSDQINIRRRRLLGTTVAGLTSLIHEVWTRPDIKQALIDDPARIPAAADR